MLRRTTVAAAAPRGRRPAAQRLHRQLAPSPSGSAAARPRRDRRGTARSRAQQPRHPRDGGRRARPDPDRQRVPGLVSRTPDQEIVDTLASSHEISADGLTYTFTLRAGVTFHDGQELTPQDVVWSLQQVKDTATYRDSDRLKNVTSIAANGQDIILTLSAPDSTLLWNLTGRAGLVFKEGDTIDRKTKANGTGPYALTDWKQGDSITLKRNDAYWGDKAKVAEVVLDFIPDTQAALSGALAGELDVVTGFDATLKDQIEANGDFSLVLGKSTDKGTLAMNSTKGPSPTSACGRRSARRSTRTRSSRRSAPARPSTARSPSSTPATRTSSRRLPSTRMPRRSFSPRRAPRTSR
jgi:ABC-type transport system substrate-binding protein